MTTATLEKASPAKNVADDSVAQWAEGIVQDLSQNSSMTIGLTNGSRYGCDRRAIDALSRVLDDARGVCHGTRPMLLVRLSVMVGAALERADDQPETGPTVVRSPLGAWSEVSVPVPVGKRASWSLEQLPHWLASWKRDFGLVLIDLGPIHEVPSRIIGRLCDGCYVLLGPDTCASRDWILQQVAWHQHSGSTICGTLVTT